MRSVPMAQAKTKLTELVAAMEKGERIVITRRGKPVAEIVPPKKGGLDWEAMRAFKKERGIDKFFAEEDQAALFEPMTDEELLGRRLDYAIDPRGLDD